MNRKLLLLLGLLGMLAFSAGSSACVPIPAPISSATPPTVVKEKVLPTPIFPGQGIAVDYFQVEMSKAEITTGYLTEYDSIREPPAGRKFLWIRVLLKNMDQNKLSLPAAEHFSVLYGMTEFKPTYGHRQGYTDYAILETVVYQGETMDAWLRFDIPVGAQLKDLQFIFLPESTQVSVGFSSGDYPWGDHPIYVWRCAP